MIWSVGRKMREAQAHHRRGEREARIQKSKRGEGLGFWRPKSQPSTPPHPTPAREGIQVGGSRRRRRPIISSLGSADGDWRPCARVARQPWVSPSGLPWFLPSRSSLCLWCSSPAPAEIISVITNDGRNIVVSKRAPNYLPSRPTLPCHVVFATS